MYQFNIIILSFTFLTYEYLPNFEEMWLQFKKKKAEVPQTPIREVNRDKALVGSCREDALWQNLQRKFVTMPLIYQWTNGDPTALMQATETQNL
jgi:hypothetical protein